MRITAVIVTYNRIDLLKECIKSIKTQTYLPNEIIVINNDSKDGTTEWLIEQKDVVSYCIPNNGGAWGFNEGIKKAIANKSDWIWLMDDDTIPNNNALSELIKPIMINNGVYDIGFASSVVKWTDGSLHKMNKIQHRSALVLNNDTTNFSNYYATSEGTFVSLLLSKKAVNKVGLPIKEYFIWNDDIEFTKRICKAGLSGVFVESSIVIHKTPTNHSPCIFSASPTEIWKYKYGLRNELYARRYQKGLGSFTRNVIKRLFFLPIIILIKRKNYRRKFIIVVWKSTINAIFFNPRIEYI